MAPILSFTAEDIWQHLPYEKDTPSVFLQDFPEYSFELSEEEVNYWKRIMELREEFLKALEIARKEEKLIGSSLEAEVLVKAPEDVKEYFKDTAFWEYFLMVAKFELSDESSSEAKEVFYTSEEINGLEIRVRATSWKKCERCWQRRPDVGTLENPELCKRCLEVVKAIGKGA